MFCVIAVFVVQELHSTSICILSILNQFLDKTDSSDQKSYASTGKSFTSNAKLHKGLKYTMVKTRRVLVQSLAGFYHECEGDVVIQSMKVMSFTFNICPSSGY